MTIEISSPRNSIERTTSSQVLMNHSAPHRSDLLAASALKTNGSDPMKRVTHVLEELPNQTINDIEDLLPQRAL